VLHFVQQVWADGLDMKRAARVRAARSRALSGSLAEDRRGDLGQAEVFPRLVGVHHVLVLVLEVVLAFAALPAGTCGAAHRGGGSAATTGCVAGSTSCTTGTSTSTDAGPPAGPEATARAGSAARAGSTTETGPATGTSTCTCTEATGQPRATPTDTGARPAGTRPRPRP